jgi:hypothetical protein
LKFKLTTFCYICNQKAPTSKTAKIKHSLQCVITGTGHDIISFFLGIKKKTKTKVKKKKDSIQTNKKGKEERKKKRKRENENERNEA